jgi:hypothetical protein
MVNNINKLHAERAFLKMTINSSYGGITNLDTVKVLDDFYKIKRKINVIEHRKQKIKKIFKND